MNRCGVLRRAGARLLRHLDRGACSLFFFFRRTNTGSVHQRGSPQSPAFKEGDTRWQSGRSLRRPAFTSCTLWTGVIVIYVYSFADSYSKLAVEPCFFLFVCSWKEGRFTATPKDASVWTAGDDPRIRSVASETTPLPIRRVSRTSGPFSRPASTAPRHL